MAVIADAFAGKLMDVLKVLITEEVVMILGVKDDLQRLQERLQIIKAMLLDAERIKIEDKTTDLWLSKLKDVMYDADDIIDLCRVKGRSLLQRESAKLPGTSSSAVPTCRHRFALFSSCFRTATSIPFRHEIGKEIQKLNQRLEDISKDKLMFTIPQHGGSSSNRQGMTVTHRVQSSPLPPSDFVGGKTEELARKLVDSLVKTEVESLLVFAIVGLGGIGKTTLAQKIYSDQKVRGHFQVKCWVCVSQRCSAEELLKQMIRSIGSDYDQKNTTTELLPLLKSTLEGKRFLLVLDDVWTADVWEHLLRHPLKQAGESSSRVLITTRKADVARRMGARDDEIHQVEKLDDKDGWALLCKSVFENRADEGIQNLREIGMKLVEKCDGLPLAIKAIAGVLKEGRSKRSEWEKVYRSQAWSVGGELPEDVRGALYLSYEDLPSQLKQCFLFCSLFPEDYQYKRLDLIRCWIAEGFISAEGDSLLEDIADGCYNSLICRNILHSGGWYDGCMMHDLTRSLAVFLSGEESYLADANESTTTKVSKLRRLAIERGQDSAVVLDAIEHPRCLRTLLATRSGQIKAQDLLQRFTHLRILDLRRSRIGSIPESIGNLHHLRYLDLDHTNVHELPESLGRLSNLQFLNLNHCGSLRTLPKGIVQLCNLRCLGLDGTPVGFVPSGIGQLRNLNILIGFVVGEDGDNCDLRQGCRLDELQSMSQLRTLDVRGLERVQMGGVKPLIDKCHLKELKLEWSEVADLSSILGIAEEIYESLSLPPNLETLEITGFFGNRFPTWICTLHNLTSLELYKCLSCQVLPPLGKLRELKVLKIYGASLVVTIGHEFLGLDGDKAVPMVAFPKLKVLTMREMSNWKEWIIDMKEIDGGRGRTIELLPRLRKLELVNCTKLRALPEGLQHATTLKDCSLLNNSMREIKNIPSLEKLDVHGCDCLESISNLPALREMHLLYPSGMLNSVEKLNSLQKLELTLNGEFLPEWLLRLLQELKANGSFQTFELSCYDKSLIRRCIEGGQYWPLLSRIPDLTIKDSHFITTRRASLQLTKVLGKHLKSASTSGDEHRREEHRREEHRRDKHRSFVWYAEVIRGTERSTNVGAELELAG